MLGAFKLNTIGKASGAAAPSYFLLTNTNATYTPFDIGVETSTGSIYAVLNGGDIYYLKIATSGTITFQRSNSNFVTADNALAVGPSNTMGFTSTQSSWVNFLVFDNTGSATFTKVSRSGNNGTPGFNSSNGIIDSAGNYWVGGFGTDTSARQATLIYRIPSGGGFGVTKWGTTVGSYTESGNMRYFTEGKDGFIYATVYSSFTGGTYITKFNTSGTHQGSWLLSWSVSPLDRCFAIAADSSGGVYGGFSTRLWKANTGNATRAWEYILGTAIGISPSGCATIDSANNVYFFGFVTGNGYILKLDSNGNSVWQRRLSVTSSFGRFQVKIINDEMYVYGQYTVTGPTTGMFFMKLPTDGTKTGTYGSFTYSTVSITLTSINNMSVSTYTPTLNSTVPAFTTQTLTYTQTTPTTLTTLTATTI